MSAKAKKGSKPKNAMEKFTPPDLETLDLTDTAYVFKSAMANDYQGLCGAFDAATKEPHPLAAFILEHNLLNARDPYHKTVFDLACLCGSKEFLRAVLERTGEKEKFSDETVLSLREPLKQAKHGYNYMHYACVWNRLDLVKLLVDQDKMITDPSLITESDLMLEGGSVTGSSASLVTTGGGGGGKKDPKESALALLSMKTLGSLLLRSKTRNGETPRALAKRYKHNELVEYLIFAEKRQDFIDYVNDVKLYPNDVERHQNKLSKDDKKKLEKVYADMQLWFEKNRESTDMAELDAKIAECKAEVKPVYERVAALLAEARDKLLQSTTNMSGGNLSARSKASVARQHKNSIASIS